MPFDVSLIQRVGKEIEESGKRLQDYINAPSELKQELQKIEANMNSLNTLLQGTQAAGSNAGTAMPR